MEGKIEAFLIDVDDCFLPTDGNVFPGFFHGLLKFTTFIQKANKGEFPPIGWCSGRDRDYIEAVSFFVGLPNCWSVIESGIALFNPRTKELLINPALTQEVKAAFEVIRRERLPRILKNFPELFDYPGNMINIALERQHGVNIPIESFHQAVKVELRDLEKKGLVTIHHSRIAVDISPPGIDKASGVKFLSQHTGINLTRVVGIGDSRGDFPMLQLVGEVGCPTNASEDCKKLVRDKKGYISPFEYSAGVADVIGYFAHEKGLG